MSENRDETTGQFTPAEPLFGQAAVEYEAGYVPLKDEPTGEDTDDLTVNEAAERLVNSTTPEGDIKTYGALDDLPENVTLTLEQSAKALTDSRAADEAQAQSEQDEQTRKEVDDLRGTKPADATEAKPQFTQDDPKFKEAVAIEAANHAKEADEARAKYVAGLEAATHLVQQSFIARFPEFAGLSDNPAAQAQAFQALAQRDPARANEIIGAVLSSQQHFEDQRVSHEQETQRRAAEYSQYAKAESDRFEGMIEKVPAAERKAIEDGIVAKIKEYGGEVDQFVKLMKGSEFANATVQRLLWDVGRLHRIESAPKAIAATKQLPPVQRPGVARPSTPRADNLASLEAAVNNSSGDKQIRAAAALLSARRSARGQ